MKTNSVEERAREVALEYEQDFFITLEPKKSCRHISLVDRIAKAIHQAIEEEREAIAKGCEGMYSEITGKEIATAIRQRGMEHFDFNSLRVIP